MLLIGVLSISPTLPGNAMSKPALGTGASQFS